MKTLLIITLLLISACTTNTVKQNLFNKRQEKN
jgi:hypothetical protein